MFVKTLLVMGRGHEAQCRVVVDERRRHSHGASLGAAGGESEEEMAEERGSGSNWCTLCSFLSRIVWSSCWPSRTDEVRAVCNKIAL